MSYMLLKDTATAGTRLVDSEVAQPEYHAFLARQEFIRAKSGFDRHSTHVCVFGSDIERHGLNMFI